MNRLTIIAAPVFLTLAAGIYATWYSYERRIMIAQVAACRSDIEHPKTATMMTAPDGSIAPVYSIETCTAIVVPPPLWDLVRGRIVFEGIPERMKVNPYSLTDILFGRYTLGSADVPACDQSATTTDCSSIPPSSPPPPYVPPNPVQPVETWVSAAGTPISLFGFSFELPVGWRGSVYREAYAGYTHALVLSSSNDRGFTVDCPPAGKGLEAATRLSSEERSFAANGIDYSIAFEKWTAPGNDPWYLVWVRTRQLGNFSTDSSGTFCLAQGNATPDVEEAMRMLYETLR